MSGWIDVKYANLLSVQLENFKVKKTNPYLANCRCPLCGDSQKDRKKARGYIYQKLNALFYKCHNCSAGTTLGNLLKQVNPSLYDQYKLERYKEGFDIGNAAKPHSKVKFNFETPMFQEKSPLERLLTPLSELPDHNPAIRYAKSRRIPRDKFSDLYYIDDVKRIEELSPEYRDRIPGIEPRLVLPFRNRSGDLIGITCRALGKSNLRYLTIQIDNSERMVYNLNNIDKSQTVYCVEGPIDSLFLPNCIAVASADLESIRNIIPKHNTTLVFDNQPRNPEVVKIMRGSMKNGWNVVVWPDTIVEKDINEMIMSKKDPVEILDVINTNTHSGLSLRMKLNAWSKC